MKAKEIFKMNHKDRSVEVKYCKESQTYDVCLKGEAEFKGNREMSLFSLSQYEAEQFYKLLGLRLKIQKRVIKHEQTDKGSKKEISQDYQRSDRPVG